MFVLDPESREFHWLLPRDAYPTKFEGELMAALEPAMTTDHAKLLIHDTRDVEPEGRDAVGDLADLFFRVLTSIAGIELQLADVTIGNR